MKVLDFVIYEHTYKYALCLTFYRFKNFSVHFFMCLFSHFLNIGLTTFCDRYSTGADRGFLVSSCDEGFVGDVSVRCLGKRQSFYFHGMRVELDSLRLLISF